MERRWKFYKKSALLIALLFLLLLPACKNGFSGSSASSVSGTKKTAQETVLKAGICIYQFEDSFMTLYREELKQYLKETYQAKVTSADAMGDRFRQKEQIQEFIQKEYDILFVNLVEEEDAGFVADLCHSAGIPVVFINRRPENTEIKRWEQEGIKAAYVGTDARQSGTYQGEIILETDNKGDINGDGIVSYITIMGDPDNIASQYRTEFSVKALEDGGMKTKRLFCQSGYWNQEEGRELAASAINQYGTQIEVIFCNNDSMANGAKEAVKEAGIVVGKDIYLVGVDALEETVHDVKEGEITGTVLNDHVGQSHLAADLSVKMLDGEKVSSEYTVDYIKISSQGLNQ